MLNYQGIAHYSLPVITCNVFCKDFYTTEFIAHLLKDYYKFLTDHYRLPVMIKPLSIKALPISLQNLQKKRHTLPVAF